MIIDGTCKTCEPYTNVSKDLKSCKAIAEYVKFNLKIIAVEPTSLDLELLKKKKKTVLFLHGGSENASEYYNKHKSGEIPTSENVKYMFVGSMNT